MAPAVQPESQAEFAALVRYFGLQDFMPNCAAGSTAEYFFDKVLGMERAEDWAGVQALNNHSYALAHPGLANGQHLVKCYIEKVGQNPWMFLGVTRQTYAQEDLEDSATSFGMDTPWAACSKGVHSQCKTTAFGGVKPTASLGGGAYTCFQN